MSESRTSADGLPEDDWHNHLYVWLDTSETACTQCGVKPDLLWAWENVRSGEAGAVDFAIRAVEHLKQLGWQMLGGVLWCPVCAAKLFPEISD